MPKLTKKTAKKAKKIQQPKRKGSKRMDDKNKDKGGKNNETLQRDNTTEALQVQRDQLQKKMDELQGQKLADTQALPRAEHVQTAKERNEVEAARNPEEAPAEQPNDDDLFRRLGERISDARAVNFRDRLRRLVQGYNFAGAPDANQMAPADHPNPDEGPYPAKPTNPVSAQAPKTGEDKDKK